ncbi:ABC transporter permease [Rhizobium rhizoryzae]|uniref:ABC-type dipeptide/oligopeptide/nickel transport system permease component n=1 Tax=Rhizobium rhizoryzae TaxID=451876 RepID=A0A7W6LJN8_9HYPH|nr:ABC transporter permease [Rhizobium rhizoryzae]MBB4145614.1 ABC-type dipeptide/oligopeptide/nickel transport system permease component [Rhizobium rhizoryzae]
MKKLASWGLQTALGLLVVSFAAFAIITLMPVDPVEIAIRTWNLPATDETMAALRQDWGLDRPLISRYLRWGRDFLHGDWGRSFRTGEPVRTEFLHRLPLSLSIGIAGLCLALLLALPLGFAAVVKPGGVADRFSRLLSVFTQSTPVFATGLVLIWVFGVQLRWIRPFANDRASLVLAIALVALHSTAVLARVYRKGLQEAAIQPWFVTARAKGLSETQALWRHAHPSALYAVLAAVHSEAGWVIGSAAAMEILFGLPGISQFLVQSISMRDQMVLQAYVMVIALWMVSIDCLARLMMLRLEPRLP